MTTDRSTDGPLVSVVLPTYERPRLLRSAVRSVAAQTYGNLELIVVDDGSSVDVRPAVEDGVRGSPTDFRLVRHDENRGANAARNAGVARASGQYVAFLDDDDYWRPEKVERQVAAIEAAHEDVGVAFVGRVDVDGSGTVTNVSYPPTEGDLAERLVSGAHVGTFSTVMVRAEAFDRTGPLDERFPCWQDREWYFRLAEHYDHVGLRDLLAVRRITPHSQLSDDFEALRDVAHPLLLDKHVERVASQGPGRERTFRAELSRAVGRAALSSGRYFEAVRYLLRSLRNDPVQPDALAYLAVALGGRYTHGLARAGKRAVERHRSDEPAPARHNGRGSTSD